MEAVMMLMRKLPAVLRKGFFQHSERQARPAQVWVNELGYKD
jgi:hypothetical protein